MAQVFLSFTAENDEELVRLVLDYASRCAKPPSWLGKTAPPIEPDLFEDQAALTDEEYDAKHDQAPEPTPEPEAAPKTRKPRAVRGAVSAPTPEPVPAPVPVPEPARELPALETLKSVVTTAVRLAQKGEGSKKILELLPAFKDTTGLDFVMNSEDKHRTALFDLIEAAGINLDA